MHIYIYILLYYIYIYTQSIFKPRMSFYASLILDLMNLFIFSMVLNELIAYSFMREHQRLHGRCFWAVADLRLRSSGFNNAAATR